MPAFSLYITADREAFIKGEAARLGVPVAKFVALLVDEYRTKTRPKRACVGKDGVSWTLPLDLPVAVATHAQALAVHPGLEIYIIPEGQTSNNGSAIPPEWEHYAPGL